MNARSATSGAQYRYGTHGRTLTIGASVSAARASCSRRLQILPPGRVVLDLVGILLLPLLRDLVGVVARLRALHVAAEDLLRDHEHRVGPEQPGHEVGDVDVVLRLDELV